MDVAKLGVDVTDLPDLLAAPARAVSARDPHLGGDEGDLLLARA